MNICRGNGRRSGLAAECAIWLLIVLLCLPAPALAATITINDTVDHRVMGNGDPDDNGNDNPPSFPNLSAPDNNTVIITYRGLVQGDVYGAYNTLSSPGQTEVKNNKVEFQDAETIGTTTYRATVTGDAYGAYILNTDGNTLALGNELVLNKSASVGVNAYGGYARSVAGEAVAAENKINAFMFGEAQGNMYGGYAFSTQSAATARENQVALGPEHDAADSWAAVFGGYALGKTSANATGNEVTARNASRMHGAVFGGYAQSENNALAQKNQLDFYSSSTTSDGILFFENVYGGYASGGNTQAIDNDVWIYGATSQADIYGGYAQGAGTAEAKNNEVTITGGVIEGNVYGGYAQGKASATASGNQVLLSTTTVKGAVFGGYAQGETSAQAIDNTVTVSGASKIGDLYGGFSTIDDDAYSDNTLNKNSSESTIGRVSNVQTVNFGYAGEANIGKLDVSHIGGATKDVILDVRNGDILFNGEIYGSGGLIKSGGDSLTFAGPVNYDGETLVSAGTLTFNSLLGDGNWSRSFKIETDATLNFNQTRDQTLGGTIGGTNGKFVKNGPGTLTMDGNTVEAATSVENGILHMKRSVFTNSVEVSGAVLSGSGRIQGDTSIRSSGDRDSSLVVDGSLTFGNDLALATSTNLVFNQDGQIRVQSDLNDSGADYAANLDALGFYVLAEYGRNATLNAGNGWIDDVHAVTVALNGVVLDANYNVVLKHYAGQKQIALIALPDGILPKFWSGSGAANWESANWAADYDPTAASAAWDDSGKSFVVFGAPGATPASVTLTEDHTVHGLAFVQDGYILDGPGRTLTLDPIVAGNPANIGVQNEGDTATINVALGGSNGLFKTGHGELVLGGPNTYTGDTTVASGGLTVTGSLGTGNVYAGNITSSGTLSFNQSDPQVLSGVISGAGSLVKQGAGSLTLANGLNRSAANAASAGDVTVGGGTLAIGGLGNFARNVEVNAGGTLGLTTGGTAALSAATLSFNGNGGLDITSATSDDLTVITTIGGVFGFNPANVTTGGGLGVDYGTLSAELANDNKDIKIGVALRWNMTDGSQHGTFTLTNASDSFTVGQALENKAANPPESWDGQTLTKKGLGTLILAAANTYTGNTDIQAGTLQIGNGGATGSIASPTVSVANGATLVFNRSDTMTYGGVISGAGSLLKQGAGVLTLSGENTYVGGTTIDEGILRLTNAGAAGTGGVDTAVDTALELAFAGTFNNGVTGGGGLNVDAGAGNTAVLAGTNTYAGMTTVKSGTLALGSDLAASSGLTLYSGTTFATNGHVHSLDNKTLTVWGEGSTYDGNLSARNATMNFITPGVITGSMLNVTGTANIDGSRVNLGVSGGYALSPGDTLSLLKAVGGLSGSVTQGDGAGILKVGATVVHDITLAATAGELTATVDGGRALEQAKSLSEGYLAGMGLTLHGADQVANQGLAAAVQAARNSAGSGAGGSAGGYGFGGFATTSGGSVRYNTGSYVDMHSLSVLTGLARGADLTPGRLTVGAFFEYGNGSYDTHNSFSNAASVDGDGSTRYLGGGVLGRMDFKETGPGRIYTEASARMGRLHNDYTSSDLRDSQGRIADYDSSSNYYGLHLGTGYVWNISETASLDLHAKYFWTRQEGDSTTLSTGESVRFKNMDSHRLRAGTRFAYNVNEYIAPYIGAAYEYEFDGRARATINGFSTDAPDLKGGTGIGELGFTVKPFADSGLSLDLAVQGYTGKHEGATGILQFKWEF